MSEPLDSFVESLATSQEMLDKIQEKVHGHLGVHPDEVTWGNVADANRVMKDLSEIVKYLPDEKPHSRPIWRTYRFQAS